MTIEIKHVFSKIIEDDPNICQISACFEFCRANGFKWIPCKNKHPLEKWRADGKIYAPDDVAKMQEFTSKGINQSAIITEENGLVVIDCDVVYKDADPRYLDPKYKAFRYGDNFNAGALNLITFLDTKARETGINILSDMSCLIWDFFNDGVPCCDYDMPAPLNCIAQTPTGGIHFYFKCKDSALYSSNSAQLCPCVDVRARGGIIIAPYSVRLPENKAGAKVVYTPEYLPLSDFSDMPELPPELAQLLPKASKQEDTAVKLTRANIPLVTDMKAVSRDNAKFTKWQEEFRQKAVQGARNTLLSKYVGRAFRLRSLTPYKVEQVFRDLARAVGLPNKEIDTVINSAKRYANQAGVFAR